jgi:hypothetical protein
MSKRLIPLILILLFGLTTAASANGGFYGYVQYKGPLCGCSWTLDKVKIVQESTGNTYYCGVRCGGDPGYSSMSNCDPFVYPPGYYTLTIIFYDSGCKYASFPQRIYHSTTDQEVDFVVHGDDENEN